MNRLENICRRIVQSAPRGMRDALAVAAGHQNGTWITNWLSGRQKSLTIDELDAIMRALKKTVAVGGAALVDEALAVELSDPTTLAQVRAFLRYPSQTRELLTRLPPPDASPAHVSKPAAQETADTTSASAPRHRGRGTKRNGVR